MEGPAPGTVVRDAGPMDAAALLAALRGLLAQMDAIGYPNRVDLVGRELDAMRRGLRRLLRELGDRDAVDV